jgi:hypothetical protein
MQQQHQSAEILINASAVTTEFTDEVYEFVLNEDLTAIECVKIESLAEGLAYPVQNYLTHLKKSLFELNHVRVNPHTDNSEIIGTLTDALADVGVDVNSHHSQDSGVSHHTALGEISNPVRFYFDLDGKLVFLSLSGHMKLVGEN